jgi:hypothetical protein
VFLGRDAPKAVAGQIKSEGVLGCDGSRLLTPYDMRDARREVSRWTRREVILSLGVATCGWALPIRAQPTTSPVIGYLNADREGVR